MSTQELLEKATARPWETKCVKTQVGRCWKVNSPHLLDNPHGSICLYDDDTSLNPKSRAEIEANAALIVRAVNNLELMREALFKATTFADTVAKMMRDYELPEDCNGIICDALDALNEATDKALALAEGGKAAK